MKIIYLPGFSLKNKAEGENISKVLKEKGYEVYFHHWRHWEDEAIEFKASVELETITQNFDESEELVVIGKSVGTHISAKLLSNYKVNVSKLILMGVPLENMEPDDREEYLTLLRSLEIPVFVIQNNKDPYGGEEQIKDFLSGINCMTIIKDRDDHRYDYPDDILQILEGKS